MQWQQQKLCYCSHSSWEKRAAWTSSASNLDVLGETGREQCLLAVYKFSQVQQGSKPAIPCPGELFRASLNAQNKKEIVKCTASDLESALLAGSMCLIWLGKQLMNQVLLPREQLILTRNTPAPMKSPKIKKGNLFFTCQGALAVEKDRGKQEMASESSQPGDFNNLWRYGRGISTASFFWTTTGHPGKDLNQQHTSLPPLHLFYTVLTEG